MKRRWVDVMGIVLLAGLAGTGCGEECPRRLKTEVRYTGAQMGVLFTRESIQGTVTGLGAGPVDATRPAGRPDASSNGCWSEPAAADTPGYLLEAWLDLDGDDDPCRALFASAAACG